MDISVYLKPLDKSRFDVYDDRKTVMGSVVRKFLDAEKFPDINDCQVAIIGVEEDRGSVYNDGCAKAPDIIREKFYQLKKSKHPYQVVDLGNILLGETLKDTYSALSSIMIELLKEGILPVILGGSQDLTYAQYVAYQQMEETVNIVSIDAKFDLGSTDEARHRATSATAKAAC